MKKQTWCFMVFALSAPPALCQSSEAAKLAEELNSACNGIRASSEYAKRALDAMLRSLKERRYENTDSAAMGVLSVNPSPEERRCALTAQSTAKHMQAARERQFANKINEQTTRENAARRAEEAAQERQADERRAAQAKVDEENRRPPQQLKALYLRYIEIQACYENRKEYRVPYVSQQELGTARTITRREENNLVQQYPELAQQKDSLWELAKRDYSNGGLALTLRLSGTAHNAQAAQLCRLTAMQYSSDQRQQEQSIKKDY